MLTCHLLVKLWQVYSFQIGLPRQMSRMASVNVSLNLLPVEDWRKSNACASRPTQQQFLVSLPRQSTGYLTLRLASSLILVPSRHRSLYQAPFLPFRIAVMDEKPQGVRGVNDPNRKISDFEAQTLHRIKLWNNLVLRSPEQITQERSKLVNCWRHSAKLASQLVDKWDWLMQTNPEVQSQICKWRLRWLKGWKRPKHGVQGDTTLLPATWSRIANILHNSPYLVADIAPHAAAILNLDADWDNGIWTDLARPGKQFPIDGTKCSVFPAPTMNKPRRYRSPRAQKVQQLSWAVPRMETCDPYRYLRSRRPEVLPDYKDFLLTPVGRTPKGRFGAGRIYKSSSKLKAHLASV